MDTGCSRSLTNISNCRPWKRQDGEVLTADGKVLKSRGVISIEVHIDNWNPISIDVLVVGSKLLRFDLLLGIDVIERLGGVHMTKMGEVRFISIFVQPCL